jgi:hypothetical protein
VPIKENNLYLLSKQMLSLSSAQILAHEWC